MDKLDKEALETNYQGMDDLDREALGITEEWDSEIVIIQKSYHYCPYCGNPLNKGEHSLCGIE